jgi:hypothetical protein
MEDSHELKRFLKVTCVHASHSVYYMQSHAQHAVDHVLEVIENQKLFQLIRKGPIIA